LWNHVRWHLVRSVTTVVNGTLAAVKLTAAFMRLRTFSCKKKWRRKMKESGRASKITSGNFPHRHMLHERMNTND